MKFYFHPRMTRYDFGPNHPLRPERLARAIALLEAVAPDLDVLDPGPGSRDEPLLVHAPDYVAFLEAHQAIAPDPPEAAAFGIRPGDNPWFPAMYTASLAYLSGSVRAAEAVRDGESLAFNLGGGLHHAQLRLASGFCVFNDCSAAVAILRERFARVAYIDIDLHHGDGVQWHYYEDPSVLTYSVHQTGRTLYPGTGFVHEVGAGHTKINVPLEGGTSGDTWLWAVEETLPRAIERFQPEAVVLQMGTDAHYLDPLGNLRATAKDWLAAVSLVRGFGLPLVALGGGGYDITVVPRLWAAATLTLLRREVPEFVPAEIPPEWGLFTFLDTNPPSERWAGRPEAEETVRAVRENLDRISAP
ncbi:MAG: hypothetical protein KIT11_09550 [Fimbriimonadaceae bacterium]|nr:hypothetical protein [Fimbriimonadaceae bacterium]QYK55572.1 MAG: hypothetical protein KF733_11220 [Fimbriimonadaceae bacterium]